uniref:Uncharacterized protein n=1 Tax=Nothobranchius furzeri TaxID=105023 RepID=A0A1A7ZCR4_NOTFU
MKQIKHLGTSHLLVCLRTLGPSAECGSVSASYRPILHGPTSRCLYFISIKYNYNRTKLDGRTGRTFIRTIRVLAYLLRIRITRIVWNQSLQDSSSEEPNFLLASDSSYMLPALLQPENKHLQNLL